MMNARRTGALLLLAALAAAGLAWAAVRTLRPPSFHGTAYLPAEPAPDFRLTDHSGRPVSLRDYRGRVVLLFFGYAHCPDVCPLTLARLRRVLDGVDGAPQRVRVLLVTVDPRNDTPAALAAYVRRFGPAVTGLTGAPDELARAAAAYGVDARPDPMPGAHAGMMTHTGAVFGIDREGRLRVLMRPDAPEGAIAADVRALLRL